MNLNFFKKNAKKKVPKNRKSDRKKMSGVYLQCSVRSPPNLTERRMRCQCPASCAAQSYASHSDFLRWSHSMSEAEKTVPFLVTLYCTRDSDWWTVRSPLSWSKMVSPDSGLEHRHGFSIVMKSSS